MNTMIAMIALGSPPASTPHQLFNLAQVVVNETGHVFALYSDLHVIVFLRSEGVGAPHGRSHTSGLARNRAWPDPHPIKYGL
jgi:hypothetical protein